MSSSLRFQGSRSPLGVVLAAAVLVAGGGVAVGAVAASSKPKAVKVCVTSKGVVRAASKKGKCPKKTHKVSVAIKGPKGATGARGAKGATGAKGDPGPGAKASHGVVPVGGGHQTPLTVLGLPIDVRCDGGQYIEVGLYNYTADSYLVSGIVNQSINTTRVAAESGSGASVSNEYVVNGQVIDETAGTSADVRFVVLSEDFSTSSGGCDWHAIVTPAS